MAKPLNELLKKDKEWKWSKECEESFTRIKARLASAEVLRHFDVKEEVTVITDASPHGLGAGRTRKTCAVCVEVTQRT